jgi:serpin B
MMSGTVQYALGFTKDLSIYELPYSGGGLALDILVPDGSLTEFETTLTPQALDAALHTLGAARPAELAMPKFAFRTQLSLVSLLQGMGVTDLFDPRKANLSGMDGQHDLRVDKVVQAAMIEVDEQGTAASATTAVEGSGGISEIPPTISSPFVFIIRDVKNGSVLFLGHIINPSL